VLISSGQLVTFIAKDYDRVGVADILGTTEFTTLELEQAPDVILQKQLTLNYKGKVGLAGVPRTEVSPPLTISTCLKPLTKGACYFYE
jgi:hypothetical protein